ncbi:MAG TPA: glycosyl hydrolase [Lacunisphaera sp.]
MAAVAVKFPLSAAEVADPLAAGFAQPPASARPRTFWFWMNGNVTAEGITRDLEAMHHVGVNGVVIYDGGTYLPVGPAGYLDPLWRKLMTHAIKEGNRLGIDVGLHNSPGWSSSGGPWIKPEQSMQQLVWTETTVPGGGRVDTELAQPQTNLGYYRDAMIVAFPALAAEKISYEEAVAQITTGTGRIIKKTDLSDGQLATSVALTPADYLQIEFKDAVELHALTVQPTATGHFPTLRVEVSTDGDRFTTVATVTSPGHHGILAPAVRNFDPVIARYVRLVPSAAGEVAEVVLHRTARISDWVAKANFDYRVAGQLKMPADVPASDAIDPRSVIDLTSHLVGGRLVWDAPAGTWTILRLGQTTTGQENVAASAAGRGLECDKFDPSAAEFHFDHVAKRIQADAAAIGAKGPQTLTIDSYEAGMQNWTANFPAEFRRRTGYDLLNYAPALFGRVVGDPARSERFLYDFRRAQADLMAENYYAKMEALAHANGMKFYVEGYGPGNFDELRVSGLPDVPMTEFWTRTPWTPNRTVKMVTSAAHVYGKPIVAAESFTGWSETSRWLDYPYSLKSLGDDMFSQGMNQMIFHRYAHQPHPSAVPGMAMGPYGFNFERTNTWFTDCGAWIDYLSRTQFMLQQGTFVADVLYFTGERSPDPSQMAIPVLPVGYTYDLINADVLLHRVTVRNGDLVLPEGGRYRLLVLPRDLKAISPQLAKRLAELVAAGVNILGPKPVFSPTLQDFPASENEMKRTVTALWNPARKGKGRVMPPTSIGAALTVLGVPPDFTFRSGRPDASLSWEHRRLADGDLFFVANRQRRVEEVTASFRDMAGRQPEIWRTVTPEKEFAAVFSTERNRAVVPLRLEPAESVFVLFRHPGAGTPATALMKDGQPVISANVSASKVTEVADVAQNFTMAMWVKPDTDLRAMPKESTSGRIDEVGKFYAIPADPGDVRFGAGHATAGLAVGRNGIFVVERSMESCPAVLVSHVPVSGWTHVAVVYRDGRPRLYVNGKFIKEGLISGKIVHSGVGSPPPPVDYMLHFPGIESLTRAAGEPPPPSRGQVFVFEGNFTPAETFDHPLADAEIAALVARGVPAPEEPVVTDLTRAADGTVNALFWESGNYILGAGKSVTATVAAMQTLTGPWQVDFQKDRGAPSHIALPELQSLHLNADSGVKYFSGTAAYTHNLEVPVDFLRPGHRVVLDLGRVEVLARIVVNGRDLGVVWKEPYRLDVTDAVHAGDNTLEIRVTDLWTNRLIGDEHLPAEDDFGLSDERGVEAAGVRKLPDWYVQGKPKPPGGRTTFTTWRFYNKDDPLVASGLLGPVRLLNPVRVAFQQ